MNMAWLNLGRSRSYHLTVAIFSLMYCIVLPGSFIQWLSEHFYAELFAVILLVLDSAVRLQTFGNVSVLSSIDFAMCAISVNLLIFELVFQSFVLVRLTTVLAFAFAMRAVMAVQHSIVFRDSISPIFRKLVVSQVGALDICYVTSRIVVISKNALSSDESQYLDQRHSSLMKSLAVPYTNEILCLSSLSSIVDSAVRHLFANAAHIISINAPVGDSTPILVVCCLLIRTGAVNPPTVSRCLDFYLNQMYLVQPVRDHLLSKSQLAQLKIFQTIMTASTPQLSPQSWNLRRVSLSQFDANFFSDFLLTVVDIDSGGKVLARDVPGTVNSSGSMLTFHVSCQIFKDTFFVFSDASFSRQFALYMNSQFHLVRAFASASGVSQYVCSTDDCDHYTSRGRGVVAKIDVVATNSEEMSSPREGKKDIETDRELLGLPLHREEMSHVV